MRLIIMFSPLHLIFHIHLEVHRHTCQTSDVFDCAAIWKICFHFVRFFILPFFVKKVFYCCNAPAVIAPSDAELWQEVPAGLGKGHDPIFVNEFWLESCKFSWGGQVFSGIPAPTLPAPRRHQNVGELVLDRWSGPLVLAGNGTGLWKSCNFPDWKVVASWKFFLMRWSVGLVLQTASGLEETHFKSLDDLIRHYKRKNQGLAMHLRHSVKRKTAMLIQPRNPAQSVPEQEHDYESESHLIDFSVDVIDCIWLFCVFQMIPTLLITWKSYLPPLTHAESGKDGFMDRKRTTDWWTDTIQNNEQCRTELFSFLPSILASLTTWLFYL